MVAYDDDRFSRNGKKIRYGIAIQITPEMLASANELWQKVDAAKGALSDDHI